MKGNRHLYIIPECYVDTNLIEYLLNAYVNYQHSCTKVVGKLKAELKDKFAVGIIDKDKVELGYIKECREIAATEHLTLMKHKDCGQYLITIRPAVDGFIMDIARNDEISLQDYGLPSRLKEFTKECKRVTSNKDSRFKDLFKALKNNRELRNLRVALEYMIENKYRIDVNTLRNHFEAP